MKGKLQVEIKPYDWSNVSYSSPTDDNIPAGMVYRYPNSAEGIYYLSVWCNKDKKLRALCLASFKIYPTKSTLIELVTGASLNITK